MDLEHQRSAAIREFIFGMQTIQSLEPRSSHGDMKGDLPPRIYHDLWNKREPKMLSGGETNFLSVSERSDTSRLSKSHIFDGLIITKETAAFQLCDIHDPMLKEMIEEGDLRETCDVSETLGWWCVLLIAVQPIQERDGWYSSHALERIKTVLRHKFFSLLQGYVATQEECEALLEQSAEQKRPQASRIKRLKYGKHNMAKGALRPEDAAVRRYCEYELLRS